MSGSGLAGRPLARFALVWALATMTTVLCSSSAGRALAELGFIAAVPLALLVAKAAAAWSFLTSATRHLGTGPIRALAVLGFFIAVPGAAVVGWLDVDDQAAAASITLAVGIATGIACGQLLIWAHHWVPPVAFWIVATVSAASLAGQIARFSRRARTEQLR